VLYGYYSTVGRLGNVPRHCEVGKNEFTALNGQKLGSNSRSRMVAKEDITWTFKSLLSGSVQDNWPSWENQSLTPSCLE
jgi:hypothetical protein